MRLFILYTIVPLLIRTIFADEQVPINNNNHTINTQGELLYEKSLEILSSIPQFENTKTYTDENEILIEVPVDYSPAYTAIENAKLANELTDDHQKALELLQISSDLGNKDASFFLGDINLYGNYSFPKNISSALHYYKKVENATAYYNVAFLYATGLLGETDVDQAKANLYYSFAFEHGDIRAGMVLGYRYHHGISVPEDCSKALYYYQVVANKLKDIYDAGPIGGPHIDSYSIRIADFQGGLYGKNAGDMRSSLRRKESRYDEYLEMNPLAGDEILFNVPYFKALMNYEGSYLKSKNFKETLRYAKYAMEQGIKELDSLSLLDKNYVSYCTLLIGKLFLRGEGVSQNFSEALIHLKKSLEIHPFSETYNELGLIYEFGPENIRDLDKAKSLYYNATNRSIPCSSSLYNYGRLLLQDKNATGWDYIRQATMRQNLPAFYLNSDKPGSECQDSLRSLEIFTVTFDSYVTSLNWAFHELIYGRTENALIGYLMAAEQGYETAQASAAYILYQLPTIMDSDPPRIPKERKNLALTYLTRSSSQFNLDSTVALGDIYFIDKEYDKAALCYESAAEAGSSQGNFNLGWLYETGLGVQKDFHLSKRHYDLALSGSSKTYLPVQLALLRLRFRSFINKMTGGATNNINDEVEKPKTWSDWKALYKKIRGTNYLSPDSEIEEASLIQNQKTITPEEDESIFQYDDLIILAFFTVTFGLFFLVHFMQQRQLRRRRENGENVPAPNFEVNFRVIAI